MAQIVKNLPAMQETQVRSLSQEDPLEKGMEWVPTPLFLPRKSLDMLVWQATVHGVSEWDTTEQLTLSFAVFHNKYVL